MQLAGLLQTEAGLGDAVRLEAHWWGGETREVSTHVRWAFMMKAPQNASALWQ